MSSNQTCLASQPPANHSLLGIFGLARSAFSLIKHISFRISIFLLENFNVQ